MPHLFIANEGQRSDEIRFAARDSGASLALTDDGLRLATRLRAENGVENWYAVSLCFNSLTRSATPPTGEQQTIGRHNDLIGSDPAKWRTGVALYEVVRYSNIADGIDLVLGDRDGKVAYDLHVQPGADLASVEFQCDGVESLAIADNGDLELHTPHGTLTQSAPDAWTVASDVTDEWPQLRLSVRPGGLM